MGPTAGVAGGKGAGLGLRGSSGPSGGGMAGRGSREDGKVGETDQNGSPKHTLKEREEKYGVETKKKPKTCLMEMKSTDMRRKNKSCPER